MLKIVPRTGAVTQIGPDLGPCQWKYHGAAIAKDGNIYAVPQTALRCACSPSASAEAPLCSRTPAIGSWPRRVLRIRPSDDFVSLEGPEFPGRHKWYGAIATPAGAVIGIPTNAPACLRIVGGDPPQISTFGSFEEGGWKWHGAVRSLNGCIWGIPANSDTVLRIDCAANDCEPDVAREVSSPAIRSGRHRAGKDNKYKFLGGVQALGDVFLIPSDSDYVVRVDCATGAMHTIGEPIYNHEPAQQNKWQNGCFAADGHIYAIPLKVLWGHEALLHGAILMRGPPPQGRIRPQD